MHHTVYTPHSTTKFQSCIFSIDMEKAFDVIVVGGGNAGMVAALSAHDAGARVALIEAAPKAERGGNSRFAGAIFRFPHPGLDAIRPLLCDHANNDPDSARSIMSAYTPDEFTADMMRTSAGHCDLEQVNVVIDKGYETCMWMKNQGVQWTFTLHKFFDTKVMEGTIDLRPGAPIMALHEGVGLTDDLWKAVENTSIEVFYCCPAHELIMEGDNCLGIRARLADHYVDFRGQVILACGGFEASPRLRRQYLGEGWDLVIVRGTRFNQGTMLEKSIAAGAQATGNWGGAHASPQDLEAPKVGDLRITDKMSRYTYPYSLMVNIDGERFIDEGEDMFSYTYAKTGAAIGRQPKATAYQIFDQKTIHLLEPRYVTGKPIKDDSISGLGKRLGINVEAFENTVQRYNNATQPGKFDPFHKDGLSTVQGKVFPPKSNWAVPMDSPPYVAYGVTCGITFTYGGIKTNTTAQVLNNEGQVMPGVYAVGEMSGGFFYHNYPGGAGLTKGAVFGRIAGQDAAKKATEAKSI